MCCVAVAAVCLLLFLLFALRFVCLLFVCLFLFFVFVDVFSVCFVLFFFFLIFSLFFLLGCSVQLAGSWLPDQQLCLGHKGGNIESRMLEH